MVAEMHLPARRPMGGGGSPRRQSGWREARGHDGRNVHRSQTGSQVFRQNTGSRGDAEPHRGSEGVLRPIPADQGAERRTAGRRAAGRLQVGLPHFRLFQHGPARVRPLRIRAAEIRCRRVPAAGHDLCRAAEGDAAPDRVRCRRGDRRALGQGHQGAGRLHGRHSAHDQQWHLRRERHRAGDRVADAPLARRLL